MYPLRPVRTAARGSPGCPTRSAQAARSWCSPATARWPFLCP